MNDAAPLAPATARDALRARIEAAERRNAERSLTDQARDAADAAIDYTRAHPLTVIGGALAFGLVIGIQVLGIALPIRFLGGLAQQSPIANQVGRLDVLFVRSAYMSRDLVIQDHLSALFMVRSFVLISASA